MATALTSYTLTSDINSALALKQATIASGVSTGDALFDASTSTIKKIVFDADFTTSVTAAKASVSLSTPLSQLQTSLSNFAVSGFELFAQNKLKRIQVPLNTSLGVPLQMAENTTGQLELLSNSYSSSMSDTLLAQKQASLVVSNVSGSSMLSGNVLKRIDVGTNLSLADSGHALTLTNTLDISTKQDALTIPTSASGTPCIDMPAGTIRKLQTSGDSIVALSTINRGATLNFACDGYTKSQITTYLAGKQDTLTNTGAGSVDLLYNGMLRGLSFSGPLGHAWAQNFNEIILTCNSNEHSQQFS